jgi:hypothetical protein
VSAESRSARGRTEEAHHGRQHLLHHWGRSRRAYPSGIFRAPLGPRRAFGETALTREATRELRIGERSEESDHGYRGARMNSTCPAHSGAPIRGGLYVAYAPDMSLSIGPSSA